MSELSSQEFQEKWSMGEDEAHDTANMMSAKAGINPHTGEIPTREGWREPTSQDYQKALDALEALKWAVADEPTYEKVANKVLRGLNNTVHVLLAAALEVPAVLTMDTKFQTFIRNNFKEGIQKFEDAEKKLKNMEKEGRKFGKDSKEGSNLL